ncbi:MAG: hypothetical protein ACRBDL_05195 [Alphaproteobacteria bacterium]
MTEISNDLMWWITVVDLPAMTGLLWMIWRVRGDTGRKVDDVQRLLDHRCDQLREALHAFKLEVAKTYASQRDLRALEGRLVGHLLRIEKKLDQTALKAEATSVRNRK